MGNERRPACQAGLFLSTRALPRFARRLCQIRRGDDAHHRLSTKLTPSNPGGARRGRVRASQRAGPNRWNDDYTDSQDHHRGALLVRTAHRSRAERSAVIASKIRVIAVHLLRLPPKTAPREQRNPRTTTWGTQAGIISPRLPHSVRPWCERLSPDGPSSAPRCLGGSSAVLPAFRA